MLAIGAPFAAHHGVGRPLAEAPPPIRPVPFRAPWSTPSRPSAPPSAPASNRTSRTSTSPSSRSSTCPRPSRAPCSRATRATRERCGGCFSTSSPNAGEGAGAARYDNAEGARAADFYERIFVGYGDDSIAQLGGAHIACEWTSNVLTKVLQRPRLGAYLEQSTRYIAYDAPIEGTARYRYYRDGELGPEYEAAMDEIFGIYSASLPRVQAWVAERYPAGAGESPQAHARAIKAKALDLLRGLLPAASLSHMGIFATGQTYEQLILHLLAHPLPEARHYGAMILRSVQDVMPSFVSRVQRPDRGGEWVSHLQRREQAAERWAARLGLDRAPGDGGAGGPSVRLVHHDGDEDLMLGALLFEASSDRRAHDARGAAGAWATTARGALLADLMGGRANRRHRPAAAWKSLRDRFEIVSDDGALPRSCKRHRTAHAASGRRSTPDLGVGRAPRARRGGRSAEDLPPRAGASQTPRRRAPARRRPRPPRRHVRALPRLPPALRPRPSTRARRRSSSSRASGLRGPSATARWRTAMHERIAAVAPGRRGGDDLRRPRDRAAPGAHRLRAAARRPSSTPVSIDSNAGSLGDHLARILG